MHCKVSTSVRLSGTVPVRPFLGQNGVVRSSAVRHKKIAAPLQEPKFAILYKIKEMTIYQIYKLSKFQLSSLKIAWDIGKKPILNLKLNFEHNIYKFFDKVLTKALSNTIK